MPPSGYSQPAVSGLVTFLKVTLGDLKREVNEGKHASLEAGLTFEIGKIQKSRRFEKPAPLRDWCTQYDQRLLPTGALAWRRAGFTEDEEGYLFPSY